MVTRVVRVDDVVPQPWASGRGHSRELLGSDDDAWRVSLSVIERDGPMETSPGWRRLLTVVDGPVLVLSFDGAEHVVEPRRPFDLAADVAVTAAVPEGQVRVLDVAYDPTTVSAFVTVLELGRESALPLAHDQAALVLQGRASVEGVAAGTDCLVVGAGEITGRTTLAVVTLARLSG